MASADGSFEVLAEIDPPTDACLDGVHDQVASLRSVASGFLVPDNHTGRATLSSLVVAAELHRQGHPVVACLNARDRNLLGLRRDLLTAEHLGVHDLLLVHGDEPTVGERSGSLSVRTMVEECRAAGLRPAATSRLRPLVGWKQEVERLFVQVSWSVDDLVRWREATPFAGPVHAGVMVMPSAATARRLGARIPELRMPAHLVDQLDQDPAAGVRIAAGLVEDVRATGAFAGVHLVAGRRHHELVTHLQAAAAA